MFKMSWHVKTNVQPQTSYDQGGFAVIPSNKKMNPVRQLISYGSVKVMVRITISVLLLLCATLVTCTLPKEARVLKKTTKEWRTSPIVLAAYADTPFLWNIFKPERQWKI
jgi:hypothetical protein